MECAWQALEWERLRKEAGEHWSHIKKQLEAIEKMAWIKQESSGSFWDPKTEGDELIGVVKECRVGGQFGTQWVVEKEGGELVTTPSHKVIQNRMAKVEIGDKVKIVYLKTDLPKVKGQNGVKLYDIFIDAPSEESVEDKPAEEEKKEETF